MNVNVRFDLATWLACLTLATKSERESNIQYLKPDFIDCTVIGVGIRTGENSVAE